MICWNPTHLEPIRPTRPFLYHFTRIAAALMLLSAAALKSLALGSLPWWGAVAIPVEVIVALGLLVRPTQAYAVRAAVLLFGGFLAYLSALLSFGALRCNCFGALTVSPVLMLAVDSAILLSFLLAGPAIVIPAQRGSKVLFGVSSATVAGLAVGLGVSARADEARAVLAPSARELVVLRPGDWIGKRMPIESRVSIRDALVKGSWLVVFVRHDCDHCRASLEKYYALAKDFRGAESAPSVALIQVPPIGDMPPSEGIDVVFGELDSAVEWFVETPLELYLDDGIVVDVRKVTG